MPENAPAMPPDRFLVRYWGVRGSIATPGPETARYGGNTSCVEVQCGDQVLILDGGTGIRLLGNDLLKRAKARADVVRATILFTHLHWDHIQGFPFFAPAFVRGTELDFWSEHRIEVTLFDVLRGHMAQPTFPVNMDDMAATMRFHVVERDGSFDLGPVHVRTAPLNHPGGATAYRIEYAGKSFVHATDHEHPADGSIWEPLRKLADGANVLDYDATYTNGEYHGDRGMSHVGWGHSTWQEAVRMAQAAKVRRLVIFHHDPDHSDEQLDRIAVEAKEGHGDTVVAYEGLELDLLAD